MNESIVTVTQAVGLAKEAIEEALGSLWIEGEVSGFKRHLASGHLYFDLKDARARVSCVMWRDQARRLRFDPVDGLLVRAHGRFGVYEVQGRLQVYVDSMVPAGLGELQAALERLKRRLADEGLFDKERKKPLPAYPVRIGVATSGTGAAIRDILRVLAERWPVAEIVHRPCAVQGASAAGEIVDALADLQRLGDLDLILLGRGGGSIEDLWCFNEESVVRAVAACSVPIVTGIGHEIDLTLADLAADRRAATPSQAAEVAVPSQEELLALLGTLSSRLRHLADGRLRTNRLLLARLAGSHGLRRPIDSLRNEAQRVDDLAQRLTRGVAGLRQSKRERVDQMTIRWKSHHPRVQIGESQRRVRDSGLRIAGAVRKRQQQSWERLRARAEHLEAIGPRAVLSRGYAICLRRSDRRAVRASNDVDVGTPVDLILGAGSLGCTVDERREHWGREIGA